MALIVEDDTGLSTAESYISVADANTYVSNYIGENSTWDGANTSTKEIAARKATQYIDGAYEWIGIIASSTQALKWPRDLVYDERNAKITGVPEAVKDAVAEAMFLHVTGTSLIVNEGVDQQVQSESVEGVGQFTYFQSYNLQPIFPNISRILSGLFVPTGRRVRM